MNHIDPQVTRSPAGSIRDDGPDGLVVYSAGEAEASGDGAGFWSNHDGWTCLDGATRFSAAEAASLPVPMSSGNDAVFVTASEAAARAELRPTWDLPAQRG